MHTIAIFGGTFDPIHNGHLKTSIAIQSHFQFDDYYFLPCKTPTLKSAAYATTEQRIDMIRLAIKDYKQFSMDLREINRDTPSYMVETLNSFRHDHPEASITLIIGYDAFLSLPQWHQWQNIIKLANLLVINRNEFAHLNVPETIQTLLIKHQSANNAQLLESRYGVITLFDAGNYSISSSGIRQERQQKINIEDELPKPVYEYIMQFGLYR